MRYCTSTQAFSLRLVSDTYLLSLLDMESNELEQLRQIAAEMHSYPHKSGEWQNKRQKADLEKRISQIRWFNRAQANQSPTTLLKDLRHVQDTTVPVLSVEPDPTLLLNRDTEEVPFVLDMDASNLLDACARFKL